MKSFRIQNIKAFVDSGDIQLAPITIFVGKNSCGKSSLVRFPAIMAQTIIEDSDSPISFFGKLLDYGNYEDVVYGHKDLDITYSLEYEMNINNWRYFAPSRRPPSYYNRMKKLISECTFSVTIGKENRKLVVKKIELMIEKTLAYRMILKKGKYIFELYCFYAGSRLTPLKRPFEFECDDDYPYQFASRLLVPYITTKELEKVVKRHITETEQTESDELYNSTIEEIDITIDFCRGITMQVDRLMRMEASKLSYIGPFRQNPDRYYRDLEKNANIVGARGENVSTILINDFHKKKELIDKISAWLHEALGYRLAIKDMGSNLFQVMIEDDKGFQSNIMDVGYGVSQVLPIVVAVFRDFQLDAPRRESSDSILIVEQPELHLHPAAQTELANLFAECVLPMGRKYKKENRKLLIETHSEHLIRKIQVLIADKTLRPDMVKVYYVDKNDEGIASISEMKILSNGKFAERWPSGFFDKAQELSMELLRASVIQIGDK